MVRAGFLAALCVLVVCGSTPVYADDIAEAKKCASIKDDGKRLECFDLLFKKTSAAPLSSPGKWVVRKEVSKLDDTSNVFMYLSSKKQHRNKYGTLKNLHISIACREKKTNLWIWFAGEFMTSIQGKGAVTYRVDRRKAKKRYFQESNDHSSLGLWSGSRSIAFIKELFDGNLLLVRATPLSESTVTAEFEIAGLKKAIEPLRKACKW